MVCVFFVPPNFFLRYILWLDQTKFINLYILYIYIYISHANFFSHKNIHLVFHKKQKEIILAEVQDSLILCRSVTFLALVIVTQAILCCTVLGK